MGRSFSYNPVTPIKTERLILNLTVQERYTLKEHSQQSHSASESEFVRKAVELFVVLYRLVAAGSDIVLRNVAKRQQHTIPIARKWTRDSAAIPDRETPRRNFELKIEETTKEVAFELVKQGAAPSATRLVWFAIGTYAHVAEWESKGFALMELKVDKTFHLIQH
jgi:hypothetical protein